MLNLYAPINNLGTGVHAYHLARAYENMGREIALFPPLGDVRFHDSWVDRWLENRIRFDPGNPGLMIFDIDWFAQFTGKPRIGFAVFETDGFTSPQLNFLSSCDAIFTPSAWGREVLRGYNIASEVVNEGYDPEVFRPRLSSPSYGKDEPSLGGGFPFRFIHVGKFEERKGTLQVLRCFFRALESQTAELHMHVFNPFLNDHSEVGRVLERMGFTASQDGSSFRRMGLRVMFTHPRQEALAQLYRDADCGIFPSKGEGWNLPLLECIASGTPAITGNWTGHSEFLGKEYPEILTLREASCELASDGVWFHGDRGDWYIPKDDELIFKIRYAYENARIYRQTEEWKIQVKRIGRFTWDRAAEQLDRALKEVCIDSFN